MAGEWHHVYECKKMNHGSVQRLCNFWEISISSGISSRPLKPDLGKANVWYDPHLTGKNNLEPQGHSVQNVWNFSRQGGSQPGGEGAPGFWPQQPHLGPEFGARQWGPPDPGRWLWDTGQLPDQHLLTCVVHCGPEDDGSNLCQCHWVWSKWTAWVAFSYSLQLLHNWPWWESFLSIAEGGVWKYLGALMRSHLTILHVTAYA